MKTDNFINVKGINTHYHILGSGPPLVFLHGHRADALRWDGFIKKLSEKFTVYAPDLPGYGKTEALKERHSMKNYGSFTLGFINRLDINNPIIFGGSMGGIIAINMMLLDESKIKKLVLFGTPISKEFYLFHPIKLKILSAVTNQVSSGGLLCKSLQHLVNSEILWYLILRIFLLGTNDSKTIRYEAARWRSCSMQIWGETLYENLNVNLLGQGRRIKTPTLAIFATGDKYIKIEETLKAYQTLFEDLEVVKVNLQEHLPKGPVKDEFLDNYKKAFAKI